MSKLSAHINNIALHHSVFALPFAYMGLFLAAKGIPTFHDFLWVTLAMIGARSSALAMDNLVDLKFDKQQNIEKLEEEKRTILAKTDKMNRLEKIIYIAFASKNDLKQVDLLNAKITELRNEKDSIQDKIDIQNKLYADTIKEKDNYIEQRKQLYIENTNVNIQENTIKTTHVQDLAKIHKIAKQYEGSEIMKKLSQTIEKYVDRLLENTGKNEKDVVEKEDEAEA